MEVVTVNNNSFFKLISPVVIAFSVFLVVGKIVSMYWKPEWSQIFYILSGSLAMFGALSLLFKAIRLQLSELLKRIKGTLIILPPLHHIYRRENRPTFATVFLDAVAGLSLLIPFIGMGSAVYNS